MTDPQNKEKLNAMHLAFMSGKTLQEVADLFGMSRQGVHQNFKYHGLPTTNSRRAEAAEIRQQKRDEFSRKKHGLTLNERQTLVDLGLTRIYQEQKNAAHRRGVEWRMSLVEWVGIWEDSGKLSERGRTSGKYVMGRLGDVGAYEVGNVEIITCNKNIKDGYTYRKK